MKKRERRTDGSQSSSGGLTAKISGTPKFKIGDEIVLLRVIM